jgi:acyl-coenzyme A synthetase/AMP-(fatty) acid ligase
VKKIGAIASPTRSFAADLPKTRSGKIMRRCRDIAEGKAWRHDDQLIRRSLRG